MNTKLNKGVVNTDMGIIYNKDFFKGKLPKEVDYSFTSPPYNRKRNDKYAFYSDTVKNYYDFLVNTIEILKKVTKKYIFLNLQTNYYNKKDVYRFIGTYYKEIQQIIVWEKSNPLPASGYNITNAYEIIIVLGKDPLKARKTYTKNHITTSVNTQTFKSHKAVMKYEVADWVFKNFIQENSLVLDPFMGTGTTAIACIRNKCNYIGFEISKEYFEISKDRIRNFRKKRSLFHK